MSKNKANSSSLSLFDHVRNLCTSKPTWSELSEEDRKTFDVFMVNRFLSMNPDNIEIINMLQGYTSIPKENFYEMLRIAIPKTYGFSKYLKSESPLSKNDILMLAKYYGCSTREVRDYLRILNYDQIQEILNDQANPFFSYEKINTDVSPKNPKQAARRITK